MLQKKIEILQNIFGDYQKYGDEYLFYCPKCNSAKKKFSINLNKYKVGVYKCWVCGYAGKSISFLVKNYGRSNDINSWMELGCNDIDLSEDLKILLSRIDNGLNDKENSIVKNEDIFLPNEFISLVGNFDMVTGFPRRYLFDRNVIEFDIIKWRIGFAFEGEYGNRIIVPSFDINGKINYFVSRTYMNDFIKYKNPSYSKDLIFNELFIDFKRPIILVEGVFDAIIAGDNSIPILGSFLSENSKLFTEIVRNNTVCYIALDPDAKEKELKIVNSLLSYDIEVRKILVNPFKDVGEMDRKEFFRRKKEYIFMNNNNLLNLKILDF